MTWSANGSAPYLCSVRARVAPLPHSKGQESLGPHSHSIVSDWEGQELASCHHLPLPSRNPWLMVGPAYTHPPAPQWAQLPCPYRVRDGPACAIRTASSSRRMSAREGRWGCHQAWGPWGTISLYRENQIHSSGLSLPRLLPTPILIPPRGMLPSWARAAKEARRREGSPLQCPAKTP